MPDTRVQEIIDILEQAAPRELATEWDAIGLQVGDPLQRVESVLVALDVTTGVVAEAVELGAGLVVAHHPLIFEPLRDLRADRPASRPLWELARAGLSLYIAHTNLDAAEGIGTACSLADALGLADHAPLPASGQAYARVADLPAAMRVGELGDWAGGVLGASRLAVVDCGSPVRRLAVAPGSAGSLLSEALEAGVDALLCGEIGYHHALLARAAGLSIVECGHYATERPVVGSVCRYLRHRIGARVTAVESSLNTDPYA